MIPNVFSIYGVRKGSDLLHDRLRHRSSNLSFSQVLLDGGVREEQVSAWIPSRGMRARAEPMQSSVKAAWDRLANVCVGET
jgi:hypothetical protein